MTDTNNRLTVALHRIEVHAGPQKAEDTEPGVTWSIAIRPDDDGLLIWGYLRRKGEEGFGQAQSIAQLVKPAWANAKNTDQLVISSWVEKYVAETLFDIARRALQTQASLMDFQFDIDPSAPATEIDFDEDEAAEAAPSR